MLPFLVPIIFTFEIKKKIFKRKFRRETING
jgi:hypothetical protein